MAKKKPPKNERQRARNIAVFLALLAFAFLVYAITIVKIQITHHL